jgi:hypothetical protein
MSRSLTAAIALLIWTGVACAQEIPPGTALPVYLNTPINANKAQAGQAISGSIAQDVPLASGGRIRAGSRVNGRVIQTGIKSDRTAYVRLRFDRLKTDGREVAITTSLRALASPWEVQEAQLPKVGPVERDPSASLITTQVGDDVVYRGGGHVMHDAKVVGDPVKDGVLAELLAVSRPGCEADSGGRRLALWVFSSSACGAYGFRRFEIVHAGNTTPVGEILLQASKNVRLDTGSALLLIIAGTPVANP